MYVRTWYSIYNSGRRIHLAKCISSVPIPADAAYYHLFYTCIYDPPGLKKAVCETTIDYIDYIVSTVSGLLSRFSNAKFTIYGDFNELDTQPISDILSLQQLVWFPTRGPNTLDLVFTDIDWYVNAPESTCLPAPPVGRSDHSSIVLTSSSQAKTKYTTVRKRVITEKAKIGISSDLGTQSWDCVTAEQDPNKKAAIFQNTVTASGEMVSCQVC